MVVGPLGYALTRETCVDERVIHLEEKVAHLEKTLDELSEMVYALSRGQERLAGDLRDLRAQATPMDPNRKPIDDVPPHYGDVRQGGGG